MKIKRLNESNSYKSVLNERNLYYYISSSKMVEFITKNSQMDWNDVCDYVREHGICDLDEDQTFWDDDVLRHPNYYNPEQIKWITAFFEAHPFLNNKMVLVFDD